MDRDTQATEIMRIEHELETLRLHYAVLQRGGERMRIFLPIALVVVAGLIMALMVKDFVAGLFVLFLVLVFAGTFRLYAYLSRRDGSIRSEAKFRWIDMAVPAPYDFYFGPTEAQRVEKWIAERENRLTQLKITGS